jgi:hypothetical protein
MFNMEAVESTSSLLISEEISVRNCAKVDGETDRCEALTTHIEYNRIEVAGVSSTPAMAENFFFDSGTVFVQHSKNSSFVMTGRSGERVEK